MREDGACSKCLENFAVCNGLCHDCLEGINPNCYEPTPEKKMLTCKKAYPWAWNLVAKSTPEEIELMRVKNSVEREMLKQEVMNHIVSQCEGFISNKDQEETADRILDEMENTA